VKPTRLLDRATTPDGGLLMLHEHDGAISIRVGAVELMSTRQHHSEEVLASLACAGLRDRRRAVVLIGGLGLGFTLRETLRHVAADATVVVARGGAGRDRLEPESGLRPRRRRDRRLTGQASASRSRTATCRGITGASSTSSATAPDPPSLSSGFH
jgi:hypothetical protein